MGDIYSSGNVSRPRNGNFKVLNDMPFASAPKEKTEVFNQIQEAASENNVREDSVNMFIGEISGRATTPSELLQAANAARAIINVLPEMTEAAQEKFISVPGKIAHHRNADYNVTIQGRKLYEDLSKQIPKLTSENAQKLFFDGIDDMDSSRSKDKWRVTLFDNIAQNAQDGIDSLKKNAQVEYIRFIGDTAKNFPSLSIEDQEIFQKAAISSLLKTHFPYKFDTGSLKEALFVVPENVRLAEYKKLLENFDENLESTEASSKAE